MVVLPFNNSELCNRKLMFHLLIFRFMATKKTRTSNGTKNEKVNASSLNLASVNVLAPAGASAGASGASLLLGSSSAGAVGSGRAAGAAHGGENSPARINKVRQNFSSQLAAAVEMENESISVIELRAKIASRWAAPDFTKSAEYAAVSAAVASLDDDIRERALNGARLAWLARPENAASSATIAEIVDEIRNNYSKEFVAVCRCEVPAASDIRLYERTNLMLSTINETSKENDYITSRALPAGLSVSGLVSAVMSVRLLSAVRLALAAAVSAAKSDYFDSLDNCIRRAVRLGRSVDDVTKDITEHFPNVVTSDDKEVKRLHKNLISCWSTLRNIENAIVLAAPAGAFGAIDDGFGGWCFPASLPASDVPAKCRTLWAKRVRTMSAIDTLNGLLAAAGAAAGAAA